jgi:signal transduction histidine kinase
MEALIQNSLEAVLAVDDPRILATGELTAGGSRLELTIKDNGRGMSENVLKHALEPLFSTKGEVGVGLSLSLVSSLLNRHGGGLNIISAPGAGASVKIFFPLP